MGTEAGQVTEEQANEALRALSGKQVEPEPVAPVEQAAPVAEPSTAEAEPAQTAEVAPSGEASAQNDDVASLNKRLAEAQDRADRAEKMAQERADAISNRQAQNEQILRDRLLKKSSVADRALKILKQTRSESGVPESEVDRVIRDIESSMNPESPSYVPPEQARYMSQEDQAIIMNGFLNEKRMTAAEADEFGKWIRSEATVKMSPIEQAVAGRDIDGFLRIAHNRFLEDQRESNKQHTRDEAVQAVKSVQRVQREAAKAASSAPAAPRKLPVTQGETVDIDKLTKDDVAALFRKSVEQYR